MGSIRNISGDAPLKIGSMRIIGIDGVWFPLYSWVLKVVGVQKKYYMKGWPGEAERKFRIILSVNKIADSVIVIGFRLG